MIAAVLREQGVRDEQITLIPDEQEAIDFALRMGQFGDLLLVFADALTRSWKQVTKFKAEGAPAHPTSTANTAPVADSPHTTPAAPAATAAAADRPAPAAERRDSEDRARSAPSDDALLASGFVRDERGLRFVGEAAD